MNVPDLTRKVVGYRVFQLNKGELCSCGTKNRWMPGVNKARCDAPGLWDENQRIWNQIPFNAGEWGQANPRPTLHDAPKNDCQCGLYAFHKAPTDWPEGALKGAVGAVVLSWGKMQVHRDGFRAEYSEIVALVYDPYCGPVFLKRIKKAAKLYGVGVLSIDELATSEITGLGESIPESLMPEEPKVTLSTMTLKQATEGLLSQRAGKELAEQKPPEVKLPKAPDFLTIVVVGFIGITNLWVGFTSHIGLTILNAIFGVLLVLWFLALLDLRAFPHRHRWTWGRGWYDIGWSIYRDNEMLEQRRTWKAPKGIPNPAFKFEAAIGAHWCSIRDRHKEIPI